MLIRTVKIDIEKILDDIWMAFSADMQASVFLASDHFKLDELLYEDILKAECRLDILKECNIIDVEEFNKMKQRIDIESEGIITEFKPRKDK